MPTRAATLYAIAAGIGAAGVSALAATGGVALFESQTRTHLESALESGDSWLRIEASLVVKQDGTVNAEVLAAEIEADTLAFLRSVQLAQVEGSRGLLHLRDDLRERAKLRSPAVVDYLIRTMVAE